MAMQTKECRNTTYLNDNAQTPLNRFAVYMSYSQLCNKYSDKSNTSNLGLSLSEATSAVGATNSCSPSATLCIAAHRLALIIFSNSTVVHTTSGSAIAEGPRDVQLQNIAIMWHYLRNPTFSRFYTIPKCDRHTQTDGRTDT